MDLYSVAALLTATVKNCVRRPCKNQEILQVAMLRCLNMYDVAERQSAIRRGMSFATVRTGLGYVDKYVNIP
jgi:hypothetical protein